MRTLPINPEVERTAPSDARLDATISAIRERWSKTPQIAIVLGTGLGKFVDAVEVEAIIPYEDLPHFPRSTAIGHAGRLVMGRIRGVNAVVMQGRCHCYEGYSFDEITYPQRVLHALGAETLVLSCAAGGLDTSLKLGQLMIINDDLDMQMQRRPLASLATGLRGCSAKVYDPELVSTLLDLAQKNMIRIRTGSYVTVSGPNYETRAELRFYRQLADAIGMSTVPEARIAHQLGMRVCAIGTITNICNPDLTVGADGHEVIEVASDAQPQFQKLITALVSSLNENESSKAIEYGRMIAASAARKTTSIK